MVEDIKVLILILAKSIQHMEEVATVSVDQAVDLAVDLQHQDHRAINKKNLNFKKFQPIKMLVHLM